MTGGQLSRLLLIAESLVEYSGQAPHFPVLHGVPKHYLVNDNSLTQENTWVCQTSTPVTPWVLSTSYHMSTRALCYVSH